MTTTADGWPAGGPDALLDNVLEKIEAYGHTVVGVFGETPAEVFSYTVGLPLQGLPELWLGTLAPQQATGLLNATVACVVAGSVDVAERGPVDIGFSVPVRFRGPVLEHEAHVAGLLTEQPAVVQVLWPDAAGRFPDEDGYDAEQFPQRLLPEAPQ